MPFSKNNFKDALNMVTWSNSVFLAAKIGDMALPTLHFLLPNVFKGMMGGMESGVEMMASDEGAKYIMIFAPALISMILGTVIKTPVMALKDGFNTGPRKERDPAQDVVAVKRNFAAWALFILPNTMASVGMSFGGDKEVWQRVSLAMSTAMFVKQPVAAYLAGKFFPEKQVEEMNPLVSASSA